MTTTQNADVLRRAAQHVRALAARSIEGPWFARHTTNDGWPIAEEPRDATGDEDEFGTLTLVAGTAAPRTDTGQEGRDPGHYQSHHLMAEHDEADLAPEQAQEVLDSYRWAAAVGPQIAGPLAALLDHAAERVSVYDEAFQELDPLYELAHLLLTQEAGQ